MKNRLWRNDIIKRCLLGLSMLVALSGASACGRTAVAEEVGTSVTSEETGTSMSSEEGETFSSPSEISGIMSTTERQSASPSATTLVNRMTAAEKASAEKTELQLLSHPWEKEEHREKPPVEGYYDEILCKTQTKQDLMKDLEEHQEEYDDPESAKKEFQALPEDYERVTGAFVRGEVYYNFLPMADYDGGAGEIWPVHYDAVTEDMHYTHLVFKDCAEFKTLLSKDLDEMVQENCLKAEKRDTVYQDIVDLYDAVISGKMKKISEAEFGSCVDFSYQQRAKQEQADPTAYTWEMDDAEVEKIRENISEYHLRDEELNLGFTIHVITPPDYDTEKSYPALVLTDAVWRFKDVTTLWKEMQEGNADPRILITVGFSYDVDGWSNDARSDIFCKRKKKFLDFLTDNLMPFLAEQYPLDPSETLLFGHSQGGVFTHYAACSSDRYENQPFAGYVIGSPAFWTPYFTDEPDWKDYQNEYGYFDRNETMNKQLYLTGGADEDKDYAEYYGENDSTLQGLEHLKERLEQHGAKVSYKIYPGNHYMYVSDVLVEIVDGVLK